MPDDRFDLRDVEFREVFPWLHLFRGFRVALDPKKILLGSAGALLMSLGWWALAWLFVGDPPVYPEPIPASADAQQQQQYRQQIEEYRVQRRRYTALHEARRLPWQAAEAPADNESRSAEQPPRDEVSTALDASRRLMQRGWTGGPLTSSAYLAIDPIVRLSYSPLLMLQGAFFPGLLFTAWTLAVWALFGGAITRIAAVQVAREGYVGLGESLRFAGSRYLSYFLAPVLPSLGILLCICMGTVLGVVAYADYVNVLLGAVWFLALLLGFVLALALFGLTLSWPLMCPAISTEATESFDALSRAFSYVLGRPVHYLFYAVVAILFGAFVITIVVTFGYYTVYLSHYFCVLFPGEEVARTYHAFTPAAGGWRADFGPLPGAAGPSGASYLTALCIGFWTHLLFIALVGFVYSYFWSAATIMYLLLRRDVDATEMEEVFIEEEDEEPFPTVAPALGPSASAAPPASAPPNHLPIIDPPAH